MNDTNILDEFVSAVSNSILGDVLGTSVKARNKKDLDRYNNKVHKTYVSLLKREGLPLRSNRKLQEMVDNATDQTFADQWNLAVELVEYNKAMRKAHMEHFIPYGPHKFVPKPKVS